MVPETTDSSLDMRQRYIDLYETVLSESLMNRKILLVCHGYPFENIGGVGQVIEQLTLHLPKLGWDVHVLVPAIINGPNTRPYVYATTMGSTPRLRRLCEDGRNLGQIIRLNEQLVEWVSNLKPDVIHLHHLDGIPWKWLIDGKQQGFLSIMANITRLCDPLCKRTITTSIPSSV